jgi:hypothetical protein
MVPNEKNKKQDNQNEKHHENILLTKRNTQRTTRHKAIGTKIGLSISKARRGEKKKSQKTGRIPNIIYLQISDRAKPGLTKKR